MSDALDSKRERPSHTGRSPVLAGPGLTYVTMKAGPKSTDTNPSRTTVTTYCNRMYRLLSEGYVGTGQWAMQREDQSVNLVRTLKVNVTDGGSTETYSTDVKTRVSVATSAYGAATEYTGVGGLWHKAFSWSSVATVSGLSNVVADYIMGTPSDWAAANVPAFSVSQARMEVVQLVDILGMVNGANISSMHVWHRIWQNVMRARLTVQAVPGIDVPCGWQNRPVNPVGIGGVVNGGFVSKNRGINCLRHWAPDIAAGDHLLVEITKDQLYLAPYINYLLGANCDTFTYANFGNQRGTARKPHIARKGPVPLTYSYLIVDGEEGGGFGVMDLGIAGLPGVGGAALADQQVQGWDWEVMGAAVNLLAGAIPMLDDMEGAWMLAMIDCFAEPYHGVQNGSAIGSDERYTAYSALFSVGSRAIPKGNLLSCILTRMTCGHTDVVNARSIAAELFILANDIHRVRVCVEPLIYALQLAMRQCGATVPLVFPSANFGQLHMAGIPVPIPNNSDRSGVHLDLCGLGNSDGPSVCMAMLDLMTVKLYECAVASPFLMLRIGNDEAAATCPLLGEVNVGECFTSVHPAQLPIGVMGKEAQGLAGVQYQLGEQYKEMVIASSPQGFYVRGIPGTVASERYGRIEFQGESGVGMLGHTITLRRASGIDSQDCRIMMSAITSSGRRETIAGFIIDHARPECYAFALPGGFAGNNLRDPMTRLDLFADFDWLTNNDLTLLLPKAPGGASFAISAAGRDKRASYVWADYLD
ncbi:hypothetical protein ACHAW5_000512 [Stephanodiscus triporus]|uniref:Coat protein n=1 Tax=Stephanodiscus triporus TaxID=2934178 RepID=A0ABD3PWJ1_9STRA